MIAAFFHHAADTDRLHDLLAWISQLGGCKRHDALLVADAATPYDACAKARKLALQSFKEVRCISNSKPVSGWPAGPNSLFHAAAEYVAFQWPQPWLVLETDCVPLCEGWLDRIAEEYNGRLVSYMGCHYEGRDTVTGQPVKAMSGIAVYPANGVRELTLSDTMPWDMANRDQLLADSYNTPLIHHFYGRSDLPPTFKEQRWPVDPVNTLTLDFIPKSAVLYHRCKDGSLIRLLRKQAGIVDHPLILVMPVCNKDSHLLSENLKWMLELDGPSEFKSVLAFDRTLQSHERLAKLHRDTFPQGEMFQHPPPPIAAWPQAPNFVFQQVAHRMKGVGRPWLWFEPDAWPLCPKWLQTLEDEYLRCGKPVMGPVVTNMGHVNGVAIYPANFCDISPRAMKAVQAAWDSDSLSDVRGRIHDVSHLMQHAWGNDAHGFTAYGGRGSPTFPSPNALKYLNPKAVLFHRCKDGSLIDQLRHAKH